MLRGPGRRAWREFTNGYRLYRVTPGESLKIVSTGSGAVHNEVMSMFTDPLRGLAAALACLVASSAMAFGVPGEPGQQLRLSPEQRQQMLQQMTPEQREAFRNARTPEERQRAWRGLSPEQRREFWQGLSPEQRELMLRRVPNEERRQMWERMTPEQREAMRQRFLQRHEQQQGGGPMGGKRLTPEERQRLRDQIRESQGEWKGGGAKGGAQRGGPR